MSGSRPGMVRTVLGDVDSDSLGRVDYHEHLFQTSPLLPGDELADESRSRDEALSLREAGIGAMIEATPHGLGADPAAVARISAATSLAVVHTTGAHHSGHYADGHPLLAASEAELAERFTADVVEGFGPEVRAPDDAPVRAGIVKAGIRYWSIGAFETRVIAAAARTSRATGCAVMVHLDFGSAAHEVLDLLADAGVVADRVVLAHMDRNLDPGLHASLAERGAHLGYDGMARHREAPDSAILACLVEAVLQGAGERIVLGGDVARASRYRAYGGLPGLDYLPRRFLPRLEPLLDPEVYEAVTRRNASRLLALSSTTGDAEPAAAQ